MFSLKEFGRNHDRHTVAEVDVRRHVEAGDDTEPRFKSLIDGPAGDPAMPGGHRGIFTRKAGAKHRTRPDGQRTQLPIEESIVQLMPEAERISRRMAEKAIQEVYPKEVRRLMKLRADRWRR